MKPASLAHDSHCCSPLAGRVSESGGPTCARFVKLRSPHLWVSGSCAVTVLVRVTPPFALRDTYADNGYASSLGTWTPSAQAQFRCNVCRALDGAKYCETVVAELKSRCDPSPSAETSSRYVPGWRICDVPDGVELGLGAREEAPPPFEHGWYRERARARDAMCRRAGLRCYL